MAKANGPRDDLTGQQFGRLTVLQLDGQKGIQWKWRVQCSCGEVTSVSGRSLRCGGTKSCGCLRQTQDLVGQSFGRLTVLARAEKKGSKWLTLCACGKEKAIAATSLLNGASTSCGCFRRERITLPKSGGNRNRVFRLYESGARRRSYTWDISIEQFEELTSANCYYCGEPPRAVSSNGGKEPYIYNGIDRKDNSIGYLITNCVSCCWACNLMKSVNSEAQFVAHCARIVAYNLGVPLPERAYHFIDETGRPESRSFVHRNRQRKVRDGGNLP